MKAVEVSCEVCKATPREPCDITEAEPEDLIGSYHKRRVIAAGFETRSINERRRRELRGT